MNCQTQTPKQVCTNEELTVMSSEKSDDFIQNKAFTSEMSEDVCEEVLAKEGNLLVEIHQQNSKMLMIKNR